MNGCGRWLQAPPLGGAPEMELVSADVCRRDLISEWSLQTPVSQRD